MALGYKLIRTLKVSPTHPNLILQTRYPNMKSNKEALTYALRKAKNPQWLTSFSLSVLTGDKASLAKDLSALIGKNQSVYLEKLKKVYIEAYAEMHPKEGNREVIRKKCGTLEFSHPFFDPHYPTLHPFFWELHQHARKYIVQQDMEIHDVQGVNSLFLSKFRSPFETTFGVTLPKDIGWKRSFVEDVHRNNQHVVLDVVSNPMPIAPSIRLLEYYTEPAAKIEKHSAESYFPEESETDHLIRELLETVRDDDRWMTVLHGEPGHGKSSSLKILVHILAEPLLEANSDLCDLVLFYEFKRFGSLDRPLLEVLQQTTNTIEPSHFENKRVVLIFDGMDERVATDEVNKGLGRFLKELETFRNDLLRDFPESKLTYILSSRSQFFDHVEVFFHPPYYKINIMNFDEPRIRKIVSRFNKSMAQKQPIKLKDLKQTGLQDFITQPILLTMSLLLLTDDMGKKLLLGLPESLKTPTRAQIYKIITRWSYLRQWQTDIKSIDTRITESEFQHLLQIIGYLIFKSGTSELELKGLLQELEDHKDEYGLEFKSKTSNEQLEQVLEAVQIGFFIKGIEKRNFGFIHASFRDYFAVKGLVYLLNQAMVGYHTSKLKNKEDICLEFAAKYYDYFGLFVLSSEDHKPFLRDILVDQLGKEIQFKDLSILKEFLELNIAEHTLLEASLNQYKPDLLRHEATAIANLLTLMTEWLQASKIVKGKLTEEEAETFQSLPLLWPTITAQLLDQVEQFQFSKLKLDFSYLDLSSSEWNFQNYQGTIFKEANLESCIFTYSNLRFCDFDDATFKNTVFEYVDIADCYLPENDPEEKTPKIIMGGHCKRETTLGPDKFDKAYEVLQSPQILLLD